MGLLIDGTWHDQWYDTGKTGGRFVRSESQFRDVVRPLSDGASTRFVAEAGRYHLYVSLACPWAHRVLIVRALKKLEPLISVSVVHWLMREQGWTFLPGPGVVPDPVIDADYLHQIYTEAHRDYSGRVTVPVLWDRQTSSIVNNESSEIIRMLNTAFDKVGAADGDYYPQALRAEIDMVNERVYETLNNGVYKAGFATTQSAYDDAVGALFATLDWLDERLSTRRFLVGDTLTEADIRLFTTLVRFDAVYVGHFKCNLRRIADYPQLSQYLRDLYRRPGFGSTTNLEHAKRHYYESHSTINPTGIVPAGPTLDFDLPHNRARLGDAIADTAQGPSHQQEQSA